MYECISTNYNQYIPSVDWCGQLETEGSFSECTCIGAKYFSAMLLIWPVETWSSLPCKQSTHIKRTENAARAMVLNTLLLVLQLSATK